MPPRSKRSNKAVLWLLIGAAAVLCIISSLQTQLKASYLVTSNDSHAQLSSSLPDKLIPFREEDRPVRRFVFYRLHKTGSTATLNQLDIDGHCKREKVCCLTEREYHNFVNGCKPDGVKSRPPKTIEGHTECDYRWYKKQVDQQMGHDFAAPLIERCNPVMHKNMQNHSVGGVATHLRLVLPENAAFLKHHGFFEPGVFHFTIIRNPLKQFLSFFAMLRSHSRHTRKLLRKGRFPSKLLARLWTLDDLEATVEMFYQKTFNASTQLDDVTDFQFRAMTNIQAKELGWDGKSEGSLERTIQFAKSINFIGLQEHLMESWYSLQKRLGWSNQTDAHDKNHKANADKKADKLPERMIRWLEGVQWADMRLYYELHPIAIKHIFYE